MVNDELKYHIRQAFALPPTPEQEQAINTFANFFGEPQQLSAMILRGAAGTGKTTLAAAIVRALTTMRQKLVLLAPTGRAAKVFSLYAGQPAYTIHRRIYRQKTLEGDFTLNYNVAQDTLFIVDEASMIPPSLLSDLLQFVYGGRRCRLLLIGDYAQLPPVGETASPALSTACLRDYDLQVYESTLNEVLRQAAESGILYNATTIRLLSTADGMAAGHATLPHIRLNGFEDIEVVTGDELIEQLTSSYSQAGLDDTIVVTRSNKRAIIYNAGIRRTILDCDDELCRGDRLMVVKNNYYWASPPTSEPTSPSPMAFIANGDIAVVQRFRNVHEQHGFRFADVTLQFPDYDDYELTATVLLDTLASESPALTSQQQQQLYERVLADYDDIPQKSERMKRVKQDRYYNALQVKFAYAVTCHKAQGGQWAHVYVDQGYMTDDMLTPEYIHWLYTAFTRATSHLYLVNWPANQTQQE